MGPGVTHPGTSLERVCRDWTCSSKVQQRQKGYSIHVAQVKPPRLCSTHSEMFTFISTLGPQPFHTHPLTPSRLQKSPRSLCGCTHPLSCSSSTSLAISSLFFVVILPISVILGAGEYERVSGSVYTYVHPCACYDIINRQFARCALTLRPPRALFVCGTARQHRQTCLSARQHRQTCCGRVGWHRRGIFCKYPPQLSAPWCKFYLPT